MLGDLEQQLQKEDRISDNGNYGCFLTFRPCTKRDTPNRLLFLASRGSEELWDSTMNFFVIQ